MKQSSRVALGTCLALAMSACGDDAKAPRVDADAGVRDGSVVDAPPFGSDGGTRDGGTPNGDYDGSGPDLTPTACNADQAPQLPPLALSPIVTGVDRLTFAAQPKGSSDWYLLRQTGQIEVFSQGQRRPTPFLDVSSQIMGLNDVGAEYGLLGLAFAPDYETSGRFYIAITPSRGDYMMHDRVIEYRRSAADPYVADTSTERVLLDLEASAGNHNGGHVAFGPDGMLYVGTGDGGGSCNDNKPGAPQDPTQLYGKILRLDPNAPAPHAAAGNPYSGATGDARVLHYGLRNPYSFSHDFVTGDLYIGDVGQGRAEELSFASATQKGLNFGWPAHEGNIAGTCSGGTLGAGSPVAPIFATDRDESTTPFNDYVSIIAGHVYRGREPKLDGLRGAFLFADYQGDRLGWLRQCGSRTSPVTPMRKRRDPNYAGEAGFQVATSISTISAIVPDGQGELYLVANFGSLLKIVPGT